MGTMLATKRASKRKYTAEDLVSLPGAEHKELVKGKLVEKTMGTESAVIGGKIYKSLDEYVERNDLGMTYPEGSSFQCYPDPNTVRKPDVSFIKKTRLPENHVPEGHINVVPDLVVEVISPTDRAKDIDLKLNEYREIQVPLIWIVHPDIQQVRVHRLNGKDSFLRSDEVLEGEDILPGFTLPLEKLFAGIRN